MLFDLKTQSVSICFCWIFCCWYIAASVEDRCISPSIVAGDLPEEKSYSCPMPHNHNKTRCCKKYKYGCCREETIFEKHYFGILYGIAILIILLLAIVISICLCSEKCFLHKLVRRNPSLDYIAKPEDAEHLTGFPLFPDDADKSHTYEVNPVLSYREKKDVF